MSDDQTSNYPAPMRPLTLPCSRSALDRLGKRLAVPGAIASDDALLLVDVLLAYSDALAVAEDLIRAVLDTYEADSSIKLALTTRVKTTSTIRQKLEREVGMGMKGMRDIAGARITGAMNRRQQDELGQLLVDAFAGEGRAPQLIDRRTNPSHGYRALHVVVHVDDLPVEVQLRTAWQNSWAQLVEKLGDVWGRGVRYGSDPEEPESIVFGAVTRGTLLSTLMFASDEIDRHERDLVEAESEDQELLELEARLAEHESLEEMDITEARDRVAELRMRATEQLAGSRAQLDELRRMLEALEGIAEGGADT